MSRATVFILKWIDYIKMLPTNFTVHEAYDRIRRDLCQGLKYFRWQANRVVYPFDFTVGAGA